MRGSVMLLEIYSLGKLLLRLPSTYALVRQDRSAIDVQLILDGDIVTKDSNVFDTSLGLARSYGLLTHRPTLLFQPMIELATQAWSRTTALDKTTAR